MSPQNTPVKPAEFDISDSAIVADAPSAASTARPGSTQDGMPGWVLPALLALAVAALIVVFWLPRAVSTSDAPSPTLSADAATARGSEAAPGAAAQRAEDQPALGTPYQDAEQARLRQQAQDVLNELITVQSELEEMQVELWAADSFVQARELATAADQRYRERQFEAATEQYTEALATMQAIRDSAPAVLQQGLELARQSIAAGDKAAAVAALDTVQAIAPDNEQLATLRSRTDSLDAVLAQLAAAAAAEQQGDLEQAKLALEQAVALDSAHTGSAAELARVSEALRMQRFNAAMSEGYAALDESRFDTARARFRSAGKLAPEAAEVGVALQELESAATAARLRTARDSAARAESEERWDDAVTQYQKALAIDSSLVFARDGLARAEPRARLDQQLRTTIDAPQRLSDPRVAEATQALLWTARNRKDAGPVLSGQIKQLEELLQYASTPVNVTLRSDRETEVTVFKVARLGRFEQRELSLRPGSYTVVGTRQGYRDVRRTVEVSPTAVSDPITIACTEPI